MYTYVYICIYTYIYTRTISARLFRLIFGYGQFVHVFTVFTVESLNLASLST